MASYITGFVLNKTDINFVNTDGSVGSIQKIPTPEGGGVIDGDNWAIPVNYGVYSGWIFQPYNLNNTIENVQPLYSVAVTKISSNISSDWYYVLGTSAQYVAAADGGTALPVVWPYIVHDKQELPVCQQISSQDVNGKYFASFALPTLAGNDYKYFPFGFLNGVALTTASSSGYTTLAALLTFLNTSWPSVGTWTSPDSDQIVIATQTSGTGTDVFCGGILAINPSA
mgnify:CR=1 FL=1